MKKQLLLLLLSSFVDIMIFGQATINCFPSSGDYNTGSTNGTDFTQTSLIKTECPNLEVGWARFDISSIPDGATIQSVGANFYVAVDSWAYWNTVAIDSDPLSATAADLYAEIIAGGEFVFYAQHSGFDFPDPGWWIADLGADAVADLQENIDNLEGWFGVGIYEFETFTGYAVTCDGWNETNQPFIEVTYLLPGAPLPAFNPMPDDEVFNIEVDIDLSWDFGDNTETYDLYFGTDFPPTTKVVDNEISGVIGVYDPGTLEYQTAYYWQVVSKNITAELETPGPIWSFTTMCDAWQVPIVESFENVAPPEIPYCWNKIEVSITGYAYVNTVNDYAYSEPNCVILYNSDNIDPTIILISPVLDDPINELWLNFFAWGYSSELSIGTITDPADASTYTEFTILNLSTVYMDYQEYQVFFDTYAGADQYIAIKGLYQDVYDEIFIDNIIINHPPSCPKPSDLYFVSSTLNTATVGWTENGSASMWNLEYGIKGFTPTGTPMMSTDANPTEILGLESSSIYEFYVQADCGGGDLSDWVGPYEFVTQCETFDVPAIEYFDDVVSPEIPLCWSGLVESTSTYSTVRTIDWNFFSAPNCVQLYNYDDQFASLILISPALTEPINTLWLNFFASTYLWGIADGIAVGTITDPLDASTFTAIDTINFSVGGVFEEYEVFFSDYSGSDQFIAFKGIFSGVYQEIYIDDITIDHPPTCPKPSDLYANGATTNSIILGWQENGEATQWNIEYGPPGFTPTGTPNAFADSNPFELTGLEDGTMYEYYVQADCGGGDVSYWVGPFVFQTLCFPASLPYEEGFEDIVIPLTPPCIMVENTNNDDVFWESSMILPNSGNYHMAIGWNGSVAMNDWFFSAPLELLGGQTYNVVFYYTNSSDWYSEKLEVLWGTEPNSDAMVNGPFWNDDFIQYNQVYQEAVTSFTPDTNGIYYVGWHGISDADEEDMYIDDIFIEWDNSLVVSATATPDEVCEGENTQLNGSAVGGSGSYAYSWTSDPVGFNSTIPDPVVTPAESTDYILEVNDGMVSIFDTVTVTVIPLPATPGTPSGLTNICANWGNTTYSTTGTPNATSYNWVVDPVEAGTISGTSTSVTVIWEDEWLGDANLSVGGINDYCEGSFSDNLLITRYLPDVSLIAFDTACIVWDPFELSGGSPAGGIYSGPGVTDGWFDPAAAGVGTHTITYTYQDLALCENSAEQDMVVDVCTGINLPDGMSIGIVPNPNSGLFKVIIKANITEKVNIKVMNSQGVAVFEDLNVQLTERYMTEVNLENYAKGLYYIYVNTHDASYIEKIVVK